MSLCIARVGPLKPQVRLGDVKQTKPVAHLKIAERLNGRLAMQGVTWGAVNQLVLNEGGIRDQIHDPHNLMTAAAITTLVTLGSSVTQNYSDKDSYFAWTPDAELLNGRLAMCALTVATIFNI